MAVKASASITLSFMVDVYASYRYYKLQASTASAPDAPTVFPPSTSSGWDDTEPSYTSGSTNTLYFVDCTVFTDDSFAYSKVSISSSYEAAKEAWNKANNAQKTADDAAKTATNYMEFTEGTGLVVGDMTSDTLGKNSLIDSDGMAIRDGTTEIARFGANKIELGKNNDSSKTSISLLNGYGNIDTTTVNITDVGEYKYLDIYAEKISMASQTAANNTDSYIPSIIITPDIASLRSRGAYVSANYHGSVSICSNLNNVSIEAGSVNFKTGNTSLTKNSNYCIYGGRVLYSNSSGSTGTITLNETANNFSMIEIFYGKDSQGYDSTKIFLPNGKTASLTATNMYSTTGIQTATKLVTISGTSVTPNTSRCGYVNLDGSSFLKTGAENMIKIRYVVGYK